MKKYICDVTGREVNAGDYVEIYSVLHHGACNNPKHVYLRDLNIEGYDREVEPELDKMFEKAVEEGEKARRAVVQKTLTKMRHK